MIIQIKLCAIEDGMTKQYTTATLNVEEIGEKGTVVTTLRGTKGEGLAGSEVTIEVPNAQ